MADLKLISCLQCGEETRDLTFCDQCWQNPHEARPTAPVPIVTQTEPVVANFTVTFPNLFELTLVEGESREIGRECGSDAVERALDIYVDVSRHHLYLSVMDGTLFVTNYSKFGTWLGTTALADNDPVPVSDSTVLRLGENCYLKVTSTDG